MDKQNLIIFKQDKLYEIIKELEKNLNFNIFNVSAENDLENKLANLSNYLIGSNKIQHSACNNINSIISSFNPQTHQLMVNNLQI